MKQKRTFAAMGGCSRPFVLDPVPAPSVAAPLALKNRYNCGTCGFSIVTVENVEGTTPMMLRCRSAAGCTGTMYSQMYRDVEEDAVPSYEWRKPTAKQYRRMSPDMQQHIDMGGLELYPLAGGHK